MEAYGVQEKRKEGKTQKETRKLWVLDQPSYSPQLEAGRRRKLKGDRPPNAENHLEASTVEGWEDKQYHACILDTFMKNKNNTSENG